MVDAAHGTRNRHEISWDKNNPHQVEPARKEFEHYVRQGWFAFATTSGGRKIQVLDFDPSLEKIFFLLPLGGG